VCRPPKTAVGQQDCPVHTERQRLAQRGFRIGRPHGQRHNLASKAILEAQRLFQGMCVVGVDNEGDTLAHQGIGDGVDLDLRGVGDLFDTGDDEHLVLLGG